MKILPYMELVDWAFETRIPYLNLKLISLLCFSCEILAKFSLNQNIYIFFFYKVINIPGVAGAVL